MAERQFLTSVTQLGAEVTPGTSVAANRLLQATSFRLKGAGEINQYRPAGHKFNTIAAPGREWSEFDIEGFASYSDMTYLLSSLFGIATPATNIATSFTWEFVPGITTDSTPQTYTIEEGSAVRAHKATYGLVNELSMNWNRESVEISGSGLGRAITDAITLTATPTAVVATPILPGHISVYIDSTFAGLGSTKALRVLSGSFSFGNRWSPLWVVDGGQSSFVAAVESAPELTMTLLMEADAVGMGILTSMRAGTTVWVRVQANGAVIESPHTYKFQIDMPAKVSEPFALQDESDVYAVEWTFNGHYSVSLGQAVKITLVNATSAL